MDDEPRHDKFSLLRNGYGKGEELRVANEKRKAKEQADVELGSKIGEVIYAFFILPIKVALAVVVVLAQNVNALMAAAFFGFLLYVLVLVIYLSVIAS